ncbi:MAG: flagellin [Quinella sp. 1Q7]|nr:flagellin [Quinella sp. 1Q7]
MRNEAHSQTAINAYKENRTHAEKVHEKLASGLKIVNAKDNSSGYAISERMRNMIRAFSQGYENIQNDSALIRTAERGISQIVDNLRTMKELAINAANDSNTDEDRRVMQKEFAQRMETINDIVDITEYNGKKLLDGTWTNAGLEILKEIAQGGTIENLVDNFRAGGNFTDPARYLQSRDGGGSWFSFDANVGFEGVPHTAIMDFSGMFRKYGYAATLHNQGFTVLCGSCTQYINVRFDANNTTSSYKSLAGTETTINGVTKKADRNAGEFTIGIKGVTNPDELAEAFYDGVKSVQGMYNSDEVLFDNSKHTITLGKTDDGEVYIKQGGGGSQSMLFKAGLIPNDKMENLPAVDMPNTYYQPLWAQHGSEAGQRFHMYINDLRTSALNLDNTNVITHEHARAAIGHVNTALEIALDEATNMGAYLQRLDVTHLNLSTSSENVQASESTIRDADMAKEMTDFTRYRILTRSSQTMLSQANHNEQSVLGLLR